MGRREQAVVPGAQREVLVLPEVRHVEEALRRGRLGVEAPRQERTARAVEHVRVELLEVRAAGERVDRGVGVVEPDDTRTSCRSSGRTTGSPGRTRRCARCRPTTSPTAPRWPAPPAPTARASRARQARRPDPRRDAGSAASTSPEPPSSVPQPVDERSPSPQRGLRAGRDLDVGGEGGLDEGLDLGAQGACGRLPLEAGRGGIGGSSLTRMCAGVDDQPAVRRPEGGGAVDGHRHHRGTGVDGQQEGARLPRPSAPHRGGRSARRRTPRPRGRRRGRPACSVAGASAGCGHDRRGPCRAPASAEASSGCGTARASRRTAIPVGRGTSQGCRGGCGGWGRRRSAPPARGPHRPPPRCARRRLGSSRPHRPHREAGGDRTREGGPARPARGSGSPKSRVRARRAHGWTCALSMGSHGYRGAGGASLPGRWWFFFFFFSFFFFFFYDVALRTGRWGAPHRSAAAARADGSRASSGPGSTTSGSGRRRRTRSTPTSLSLAPLGAVSTRTRSGGRSSPAALVRASWCSAASIHLMSACEIRWLRPLVQPVPDAEIARHSEHAVLVGVDDPGAPGRPPALTERPDDGLRLGSAPAERFFPACPRPCCALRSLLPPFRPSQVLPRRGWGQGPGRVVDKEAEVITDSDGNDSIAIRSIQRFTLGFDHRIVDGADAGSFMSDFKSYPRKLERRRGWKLRVYLPAPFGAFCKVRAAVPHGGRRFF